MGQYKSTKTKNNIGNTARETLSISRHMIFSTPVSVSVHATDSKLWRLAGFGGPLLPCKDAYKEKKKEFSKTFNVHAFIEASYKKTKKKKKSIYAKDDLFFYW